MNILKRNKSKVAVILITLILTATIMYFNIYRFSGYSISIGNNTITYVKSKSEFNKAYMELIKEVKSRYSKVITKEDFALNKVKVDDIAMFISGEDLKKTMFKKFNIVVNAFVIKSDNKKLAYVMNDKQGTEILNSLKDYYSKGSKLNGITKVEILNKISYEAVVVKTGNLYENSEIVKALIEYNNRVQKPLITIKVIGNVSKEQTIYATTVIKSSSTLMNGVNKTICEGKDGIKKVTTEVIVVNKTILSERVLQTKIITPAQSKEIFVGNYKPKVDQLTYKNSPSRGRISSNFGMRWGKMHKGIDIAASYGATISAVLDGTVSYAAWEDGYGNVIKINDGDGIETIYAHCSVITVKKGEVVKTSEKIGEVGSTGNSTGPHVHFEVRKNGEAINPEKYIK
ncbi:M23 family metallopeptidase [Clostridium sp.]|uniref:M23 family metallopeptidase n=1 Tax=Clostridium sp. TaxID=1506 RepID=UPI003D6D5F37